VAVYAEYDALRPEAPSEPRNEFRIIQRRRIDGNLVGALVQHVLGIGQRIPQR